MTYEGKKSRAVQVVDTLLEALDVYDYLANSPIRVEVQRNARGGLSYVDAESISYLNADVEYDHIHFFLGYGPKAVVESAREEIGLQLIRYALKDSHYHSGTFSKETVATSPRGLKETLDSDDPASMWNLLEQLSASGEIRNLRFSGMVAAAQW